MKGLSKIVLMWMLLLAIVSEVHAAGDVDAETTSTEATVAVTEDLGPANFKSSVEHGTWWVKFFSPYCPHCKSFAPLWSKTAADLYEEATAADFHFANVDCSAHGDLCNEWGIRAYPTLLLLQDGKLVDTYAMSRGRSVDILTEFARTQMKSGPALKETKISEEQVTESQNTVKAASSEKIHMVQDGGAESEDTISTSEDEIARASTPTFTESTDMPNPSGVSVPLTRESFNKLVTSTRDGYFIKFYVPWCSHCQAMEPAWLELARQMQNKLNIAEVNCENEKQLCKDARLQGYPSLMYFVGSERVEYDGLRGVGDLVAFATKAMNSKVRSIDATEFEEIEAKEEVFFLYFYDENTAKEDFDALDRVSLPLIGHAPLFTTNAPILASRFRVTTFPRLVVISDGRPSYYTALSPKDMRDHLKVLVWMKTVWLPILPELTASNSHEIMEGRIVVLGVLDKSKEEEFELSKKELKSASREWLDLRAEQEKTERQTQRELKEMKIEEASSKGDVKGLKIAQNMHVVLSPKKEVGFAWVDGLFWERWLQKTYGINVRGSGQRVIINDEDNKIYWDSTVEDEPLLPSDSKTILDTLRTILKNPKKITPKSTTTSFLSFVQAIKLSSRAYPFTLICSIVGITFCIAWFLKGRLRQFSRGVSGSNHSIPQTTGGKFD
ncbi:thioredoxin-like protein [Dipodascopsis uninucleata]